MHDRDFFLSFLLVGSHNGTALHHAAKKGLELTVHLLLSHGGIPFSRPCLIFLLLQSFHSKQPFLWGLFAANPFITNDDCNTALDLAREKGHVNVVRAIEVYFFFSP
jgi:ankyrin repeat protein